MQLTICLITKGREKYLDQILRSFDGALKDSSVRFLVIDNGSPTLVAQRLQEWQRANSASVDIVRLDVNDSRPSVLLQHLYNLEADWVIFPSDDDEFQPGIIDDWRNALRRRPDLVGFATSAAIINERGDLTGEVLIPSAFRSSGLARIAWALHEPPFHWPSLFLRLSKLPLELPSSRFVFDWWVGIQLLLVGEVEVSNSIGLNYRVHPEQESFLAPLNRKYFEAQVWLFDLLNTEQFKEWAISLTDDERIEFWQFVTKQKPIYSDPNFSRPVFATLHRELIIKMISPESSMRLSADFALLNGILLRDGETKNLIYGIPQLTMADRGNVRIIAQPDVCSDILEASALIHGSEGSEVFHLSCSHSSKKSSEVRFNCSKLFSGSPVLNADLLINELTNYYGKRIESDFILTSGERIVISLLRTWKRRLPWFIRRFLRTLKNSTIQKS
ncbi:MAG: glycosyltransferase family 2 protein [Streptomycetaceae bacterium]|nr:MAG: glycosyltransferase family 2 protein [Streptomycetaceae bacterium]